MASKKARAVKTREELPDVMRTYLLVLEGKESLKTLQRILAEDARWTGDGATWIEGRDAVRAHIETARAGFHEVTLVPEKMQVYEDGCTKMDFLERSVRRDEGGVHDVETFVVGMYEYADGKLTELCEYRERESAKTRRVQ